MFPVGLSLTSDGAAAANVMFSITQVPRHSNICHAGVPGAVSRRRQKLLDGARLRVTRTGMPLLMRAAELRSLLEANNRNLNCN
jgi:hypothetical protein